MQRRTFVISAPHIPSLSTPAATFAFVAGQTYKHVHVIDTDANGTIARAVEISYSIFKNATFENAKLTHLGIMDSTLNHCDLTTADCSELSFLRVSITHSRMSGWDANQGTFEDVTFQGCKLDMANFRACRLTRVRFVDCLLREADFLGTTMADVTFENCLLEKVELSQCRLTRVDFRTSQLIGITGWHYMKGAILDSVQLTAVAPYLANALGIDIDDEE